MSLSPLKMLSPKNGSPVKSPGSPGTRPGTAGGRSSPARNLNDAGYFEDNETQTHFFPTNSEAKEYALYFTDRGSLKCSFSFEDLMVLVTMFVLFGDDIRILGFEKGSDETFMVLMSISLFIFSFEFLINSWSKTTLSLSFVEDAPPEKMDGKNSDDKGKVDEKKGGISNAVSQRMAVTRVRVSQRISNGEEKKSGDEKATGMEEGVPIAPVQKEEKALTGWRKLLKTMTKKAEGPIRCVKSIRISSKGYLFGFYFWLDLLAVVSMFPDIPWVAKPLGVPNLSLGATSEVGATAKLSRVVRMVRLVRLVKLYKAGTMRNEAKQRDLEKLMSFKKGELSPEEFQEQQEKERMKPTDITRTKVGAQLSDTTTKRVISICLMMLCFVPLLSANVTNLAPGTLTSSIQTYNEHHDTWNLLASILEGRSYFEVATPRTLPAHMSQPFLVYLEVYPSYPEFEGFGCHNATPTWQNPSDSIGSPGGSRGQASVCLRKEAWVGGGSLKGERALENANDIDGATGARLRSSEVLGEESHEGDHAGIHYSKDCCLSTTADGICTSRGACYVRYKFNMKVEMMDSALLSVITTLFVAFMLVVGAMTFNSDAQRLVLDPIEEMMAIVTKFSEDPSSPFDVGASFDEGGRDGKGQQYETRQITNTIKKIGELLRIGFGVAGSAIVKENLSAAKVAGSRAKKVKEEDNTDINLMDNPGKRIYSVFGFCMIEDFDHATEQLGDGIMGFVNDVASVVHKNVNDWGGECNKNLGGSFLMTWKVPEEYTKGDLNDLDVSRIPYIAKIADKALIGFLKVIADLNRDPNILKYRNNAKLNSKSGTPFKVRMGFGLHIGWGIEGPVGSMQKVDATYLSPHVNMAARCETAAKQWDVPLLCTDVFFSCLSKAAQEKMRQLDKIVVKGSAQAVGVYTYDAYEDQAMVDIKENGKPVKRWVGGFEAYTALNSSHYDPDTTTMFEADPDLLQLRQHMVSDDAGSCVEMMTSPNSPANPLKTWLLKQQDSPTKDFKDEHWMTSVDISAIQVKGLKKYLDGEWGEAHQLLRLVDHLVLQRKIEIFESATEQMNFSAGISKEALTGDGPSRTLLDVMKESNFVAPPDWDSNVGRALTSK